MSDSHLLPCHLVPKLAKHLFVKWVNEAEEGPSCSLTSTARELAWSEGNLRP